MGNNNYHKKDTEAILAYLRSKEGVVEVSDIIDSSGANKLRVHPILFELTAQGIVEVVRESEFGSAESVRLKNHL